MKDSNPTLDCSFCNSNSIHVIMDFGEMALAGGFLTPQAFIEEPKFKMRLCHCKNCFAVQIIDRIEPDVMFKDYFYFSSSIKTLLSHFEDYAKEICDQFLNPSSVVVEFGCNDGVLLKPLTKQNIKKVIGVDPALNVISTITDKKIHTICDYFTESVSDNIRKQYGPVDLILANNVYAHIVDIQSTTKAVESAMADDGVFAFEVHYLGEVIQGLQYDMIYHEHIYYYSLVSAIEHFKRYNMTVFDIKMIPIHGGSIRFYVCKDKSKYAKDISQRVTRLLEKELEIGYHKLEPFHQFSERVSETKETLIDLLIKLKGEGKTIAGYGASGRANTMIQYCGIGDDLIDYMIDDAPAKLGYYTPGSHLEIKSNDILFQDDAPDYVVVFAWTFFEEIKNKNLLYLKNGGKFIIPLPEVSIYEATN